MELRNPKMKNKIEVSHPIFPIFIESELGIPLKNWVPIVCTGVFNSVCVEVRSRDEMNALYNMGNFGKGSVSRSRPNEGKFPPLLRERQYKERMKWKDDAKPNKITNIENVEAINELHSIFEDLLKNNIIEDPNCINKSNVDLVSCDKEIMNNSMDVESCSKVKLNENTSKMEDETYPDNLCVILPDSDSENDYFENLEPKLCIDESNLHETLILSLEEAYFLAYGLGCLQIVDESNKKLNLDQSWKLFSETKFSFPIQYAVYHHFRSKGWVVKPGIKFGGDFLLYKKGQMYYHASYIVFVRVITEVKCIQEKFHSDYDWITIQNSIRMSTTTGKEILFANVEIPKEINLNTLRIDPSFLQQISINETLIRRWTSSEPKKDHQN